MNPAEARADKFKEQGNAAFKAGDYNAAVAAYGAAIQMTSRNPVLYSNRAMASLKVGFKLKFLASFLPVLRSERVSEGFLRGL